MSRYIDADKFEENKLYLRARLEFPDGTKTGGYWAVLSSVVIKDAQTEDVAPVIHAYWKESDPNLYTECSNCGQKLFGEYDNWNYCPNCGARMDGKKE